MSKMRKMIHTDPSVTSVSVMGVQVNADEKGIFDVPDEVADNFYAYGLTNPPPAAAAEAPAKKAPKQEDRAG